MATQGNYSNPHERALSRRGFLAGTLTVLSAAGLLAACGGDGDEEGAGATSGTATTTAPETTTAATTTEATTTVASDAPVQGGILLFSSSANPSGLDPAKFFSAVPDINSFAVFNRLLEIAEDGQTLRPELAELPDISSDGLTYTFNLQPGVMFHHGRELIADDVKFSLERLMSPAFASEGSSLYTVHGIVGTDDLLNERTDELEGIKIVDEQTLVIELEHPSSSLLYTLALGFASIVPRDVVEEVGNEQFNLEPVGSGPFRNTEIDLTRKIVLERNADYWQAGRPYLDGVEWEIGVDPELAHLRLQSGELDLAFEQVPPGLFSTLQNDPALEDQLLIGDGNLVYYLTLSFKHEALKNLQVRQAIAHAIDKERLIRSLKGLGTPATGGLFSPLSPYWQDGIAYPYDPEQAKQLLSDAGFANGFEVTIWGQTDSPYAEMGQTAKQDLEAVGIKVDLQLMPRDPFFALSVESPSGVLEFGWELIYPHGSFIMDSAFTQAALDAGCCNYSAYVNPSFDELTVAAAQAVDPDEVVELYKEMDRIVVQDDVVWVPTHYPKLVHLVSKRLRGYQISAGGPEQVFFNRYSLAEA